MRSRGARLQLRVELTAHEPRMIRELDHLHELSIRREPAELHAVLHEQVAIRIRHLVAMTVPLTHFSHTVHLSGARAAREPAWVRAESHGAAHVGDVLLRLHERDDWVVALRRELARVAVVEPAHVARELDDRRLHAETDTEERHRVLARVANR